MSAIVCIVWSLSIISELRGHSFNVHMTLSKLPAYFVLRWTQPPPHQDFKLLVVVLVQLCKISKPINVVLSLFCLTDECWV